MKPALSLPLRLAIGGGVTVVGGLLLFAMSQSVTHQNARVAALVAKVPLELWSAQAVNAAGELYGNETRICADPMVRDGLQRANPRINGEVCAVIGQPAVRGDQFSARCLAGGQQYAVSVVHTGDVHSDFTVRMRTQPIGIDDPGALMTIRYRKVGPCPAGWTAGQSLSAGAGKTYDALDTRM